MKISQQKSLKQESQKSSSIDSTILYYGLTRLNPSGKMLFFQSGATYLEDCLDKKDILPVKRGVYLIECINKITSITTDILACNSDFLYFGSMEELHGEPESGTSESQMMFVILNYPIYTQLIKNYCKRYSQELYLLRSMLIKHMSKGCPAEEIEALNNQFALVEHYAYTFILKHEKKKAKSDSSKTGQ